MMIAWLCRAALWTGSVYLVLGGGLTLIAQVSWPQSAGQLALIAAGCAIVVGHGVLMASRLQPFILARRWQTSVEMITLLMDRGLSEQPGYHHWSGDQFREWRYEWILRWSDQGELLDLTGRFLSRLDYWKQAGRAFGHEYASLVAYVVANVIHMHLEPRKAATQTVVVTHGQRMRAVDYLNRVVRDEAFATAYGRLLVPFFRWYLARPSAS